MSRASHWQRARAAQALRDGKTYVEAARAAKVHVRTVFNWMKEPGFLDLVAGRGVITLGPVEIRTGRERARRCCGGGELGLDRGRRGARLAARRRR